MNSRTIPSRARIVLAAALAVAAVGCGSGSLDKAGGAVTRPVTLTLADESGDPSDVRPFTSAVSEISHGALQIKVQSSWPEPPLIHDVQAGKAQLGSIGTRVFGTVGVNTFEALQAPFLVDSYALQRKVLDSGVSQQMLAALKPKGLVGLGLLPGPMARPAGFTRMLLAAATYRGAKIGILPSAVAGDTFRALGAVPDLSYSSSDDGGEYDVEAADTGANVPGAKLTGNVVFWPLPGVIFMNQRAFASLTAGQRSELLRAGTYAQTHAKPYFGNDAAYAPDLCRRNEVVTASAADLSGLRVAVEPVYARLEADAATKAFIAEITSLRRAIHGSTDSVTCPPTRNTAQSTTKPSPVEGMWQVTYTKQEFVAAGAPSDEIALSGGSGHFSLEISGGHWWLRLIAADEGAQNQSSASGTYTITGDKILFRRLDRAYPGSEVWGPYIWSVYRDTLTFKKAGAYPMPTGLVVKPWLRVGT
jgi:TRAP-type C4-dicarboxylate transport system substrate-binding protein